MNVAGQKKYQERQMILITALGAPQPELVKRQSHRFQERAVRVSLSSTTKWLQAPVIRLSTLVNTMKRFIINRVFISKINLTKEGKQVLQEYYSLSRSKTYSREECLIIRYQVTQVTHVTYNCYWSSSVVVRHPSTILHF